MQGEEKNRDKENRILREKKRKEEKKAVWDPLLTLELFSLIVTYISAVCNLNHFNRTDMNYFYVHLSFILILSELHLWLT